MKPSICQPYPLCLSGLWPPLLLCIYIHPLSLIDHHGPHLLTLSDSLFCPFLFDKACPCVISCKFRRLLLSSLRIALPFCLPSTDSAAELQFQPVELSQV
uniref:Uncharacterized protein n=1 Tax=Zea mays TaxID=4577 RepID=C4J3B2_MAIZE|nr:unknown [Zea mays]